MVNFIDRLLRRILDSKGRWYCCDCQLTEKRRDLLRICGPGHEYEVTSYVSYYKGDPKPISPEKLGDVKKMSDGSFKCIICQEEELKDRIIRVTPNSDRAHEIIQERESDKRFKERENEVRRTYVRK